MTTHPIISLFGDFTRWQVFASGHASGLLSRTTAPDGSPGLRLDYDFRGGSGFVALRRTTAFTLPSTFEIGFFLRGEGPGNHFEMKVAAPGGANVWRYSRHDLTPPHSWSPHHLTERDLPFAWGPAGGGAPSEVEAVEFVVVAGPGGKGWIELASLSYEDQTLQTPVAVRASSHQPGSLPASVFATEAGTEWRAASDDAHPWWEVDFGKSQRFGGLVIHWPEPLPPRAYTVELSENAHDWKTLLRATSARGVQTHIPAPKAEARFLRLTFAHASCAALKSITLRPDAFTHTPNEFIHAVAADFPRGYFPRYWLREQSYWTTVGTPEGGRRALINEEGLVETDEAGFSLEPFILTHTTPVTWATARTTLSLPKGGIPVPSVRWRSGSLRLDIQPWVDGIGENLTLHITYRLACRKPTPGVRLVVAIRPCQVDPPWQAFRNLGGRSPIHHIDGSGETLSVAGRTITATPRPEAQGAASFEEGEAPSVLTSGDVPRNACADDPSGLASAEMVWTLPAGESSLEVTVSLPFSGTLSALAKGARAKAMARWRTSLGAVKWHVPTCAAPAFDCFRTAAGHILINRDGPAIQPGPRRYTRSWIRDSVIMGAALAKAGRPETLQAFISWYAPFQREDGFVPCVVDRAGVDWFVEHDSHGQFLWGVREVYRNSGNNAFLRAMLPHIGKAADFLMALRAQRMTPHYQTPDHAACFGLLPESASHEGYLAHPVHSFWDDFWGVRGLEAAAELSSVAGQTPEALRWKAEASRFRADLLRSINKVIADRKLAYIPGSVEWADFDPTATANAIATLDFADSLPDAPLRAMMETYLDGFHRKHRGEMPWINYTAYEIRLIGAFVRLGKRDIANELLTFFLADRRPREWNQWPEITWRDPRSPGHLGDLPHTWIAAEYLLALASMVAAEREDTASVVLASGMPWAWISEEGGFSVSNLPTRYGQLDFTIRAVGEARIEVSLGGSFALPPGGLKIAPPLVTGKLIHLVETRQGDDAPIDATGTAIRVQSVPFAAALHLGTGG